MSNVLYPFQYQRNAALKIFSKIFVGTKDQGQGEPPLGFATPYEDNAAGRKRQETVRTWARGYGRNQPEPELKILENELRAGWVITDDIKRTYWGGGNVVWRVLDPLGYELEIQSRNLMALIQTSGIQPGGLIPGKCILARSGADNILLHESSDEYQSSIKAAETLKKPGALKDRQPGKLYLMQDGSTALFVGVLHASAIKHDDHQLWANVVFPELNGHRPLSKAGGWMYSFKPEPTVKYEAIIRLNDGKFDAQPSLMLYRQASLAQELDQAPPDHDFILDDGQPNLSRLRELQAAFASTATSAAWVALSRTPIKEPLFTLMAWTEEKYRRARTRLLEVKSYLEGIGRMDTLPSYGGANGWLPSYGTVFYFNGQLFGALGMVELPGVARSYAPYALPWELKSDLLRGSRDNDSCRDAYTRSYPSSWARHDRYTKHDQDQLALILPPRTFDEYMAFFEGLYNERAIFDVVVK